SWDQDAIETPKIVSGYDPVRGKTVTRIYYTGWRRIQTGTDSYGCPVYDHQDWKIGMAEWSPASNQWTKRSAPVLQGANSWELMHYLKADGTPATYSVIGDQTVIYVPGLRGGPGTWHMYYQTITDSPMLQAFIVHAVSTDGVNWPASGRAILQTHPPSPNATLPGGPYSIDVTFINGRYYFVGWLPNANDANKQGLWMVSSSTPDGSANGDFTKWVPLVYDANGTWWHSADPESLASHTAGLVAPTLVNENGTYWLYYHGVRRDADGLWTSLGRVQVNQTALQ
ncbi:MAG: hypothetical protein NTY38_25105, partial [Acidobacteria bacterium]|nr:hypothetical protein [Acidobacteriota bacterium]